MNNENILDKINLILKPSLNKPVEIVKSGNIYLILNNETSILKIIINHKKQIELEFMEFNQKKYNKDNLEIINIIIKILRKNNIKFFYNELKLKQLEENHNLQTNMNYKHTENEQSKCQDANKYFYQMFDKNSSDYKKGVLIYHNKILIGVLKLVPKSFHDFHFDNEVEQKTILSFRLHNNNVPLEEFMIYNTSKETYLKIRDKININKIYNKGFLNRIFSNKWAKINFTGEFPINKIHKRRLFNENTHDKIFIKKIEYTYNQNKDKTDFDATIEL
jgi:hypothetical protein